MSEHKQLKVAGYLIIQKPTPANYSCTDNLCYYGITRPLDEGLVVEYYEKKLPSEIHAYCKKVREENSHNFHLDGMIKDLGVAQILLAYSNRDEAMNELIAVYSAELEDIMGSSYVDADKAVFYGYDIIGSGEWSLIQGSIFTIKDVFADWEKRLNKFGLFDDAEMAEAYRKVYDDYTARGIVEELADDYQHDVIAVYGLFPA